MVTQTDHVCFVNVAAALTWCNPINLVSFLYLVNIIGIVAYQEMGNNITGIASEGN